MGIEQQVDGGRKERYLNFGMLELVLGLEHLRLAGNRLSMLLSRWGRLIPAKSPLLWI